MKKVIWKYEITVTGPFHLDMPRGASVISFQAQGSNLFVWALVEPHAPPVPMYFALLTTGEEFETKEPMRHIGSAQLSHGELVFHLYQILRVDAQHFAVTAPEGTPYMHIDSDMDQMIAIGATREVDRDALKEAWDAGFNYGYNAHGDREQPQTSNDYFHEEVQRNEDIDRILNGLRK